MTPAVAILARETGRRYIASTCTTCAYVCNRRDNSGWRTERCVGWMELDGRSVARPLPSLTTANGSVTWGLVCRNFRRAPHSRRISNDRPLPEPRARPPARVSTCLFKSSPGDDTMFSTRGRTPIYRTKRDECLRLSKYAGDRGRLADTVHRYD